MVLESAEFLQKCSYSATLEVFGVGLGGPGGWVFERIGWVGWAREKVRSLGECALELGKFSNLLGAFQKHLFKFERQ